MAKDFSVSKLNIMELIDKVIGGETMYIPNEVNVRSDISFEAKIVFAISFDECARKIDFRSDSITQAAKVVTDYLKNISIVSVSKYIDCTAERAEQIKSELYELAETTNVAACLRECDMTLIAEQKINNSFSLSDYAIDIDKIIKSFSPRERAKFLNEVYALADDMQNRNSKKDFPTNK